MKPPTSTDITAALKAIEATELPEQHPRVIARQRVAESKLNKPECACALGAVPAFSCDHRQRVSEWRSNAEREWLPITNTHDDKGAPVLDKDAVVRGSYPTYRAELNEGRSWWRRLLRRRR